MKPVWKDRLIKLTCIITAAMIWLPCMHLLWNGAGKSYRSPAGTMSPQAKELAAYQMHLWNDPAARTAELSKMRASNAEWNFMGRSFVVWTMANIALRDESKKSECLRVMDQIIEQTLTLEKQKGIYYFLMPYARNSSFIQKPERSLFIDGEIALMLGMRRVIEEKPAYKQIMNDRVRIITDRMEHSPTLSAESYPNECWVFCNVVALDALRFNDYLDGADHSNLIKRWVALAKLKLCDPKTGLLVSAYTLKGKVTYPAEGSTLWMAVHCLSLIDPEFAHEQYLLTKKQIARSCLGFGYAREYSPLEHGVVTVDSGMILPGLDVSAGSTGMAFLGRLRSTINLTSNRLRVQSASPDSRIPERMV